MENTCIDLSGKVAVVTGSSRGIGKEIALRFAAAGARVVVNYSRDEAGAQAVVEQIGASTLAIQADLADAEAVRALIDQTVEKCGRIDILVNNAATFAENRFEDDDYEAWQQGWLRTFQVNVFGLANAAYLAMQHMRRQGGGKVINIASRAAFRGETTFADYGASKAAVVNLTRSMARACAKDGIVTTCVAPGFVETEMAAVIDYACLIVGRFLGDHGRKLRVHHIEHADRRGEKALGILRIG